MSGMPENDSAARGHPMNGTGGDALRTRIADLLDDVTVAPAAENMSGDVLAASGAAGALAHAGNEQPASVFPYQAAAPAEITPPVDSPPPLIVPPAPAETRPSTDLPVVPSAEVGQPSDRMPPPIAGTTPAAVDDRAQTPDVGDGPPQTLPPEESPELKAAPAINIRGRSDGVAIEVGRGPWFEIMAALADRLDESAGFFRNAQVAMDVGPRPVDEGDLRQMIDVLDQHNMKLGALRTSSERTFQSALTLGVTATLESAEGMSVAAATPAATNEADGSYFVYRGYLRSGHRLRRKEHVLVIGDVNPGAEVVSDGDVYVWGRLRGVVHAGVNGDTRALVAALDLEPTQLRIAEVIAIGPDPKPDAPGRWFWKKSQFKRPEVARLNDGEMFVEEWDISRPGGLATLRRGR